jgi:hypothetical protein
VIQHRTESTIAVSTIDFYVFWVLGADPEMLGVVFNITGLTAKLTRNFFELWLA